MKRVVGVVAPVVVAGGLVACGGAGSSGEPASPSGRPTAPGSSSSPGPSSPGVGPSTSTPAATADLPDGFPLPDGAQPRGAARTSEALTIADYTVPDGRKAYDGLVADLPRAGWALRISTWRADLGSGTITASGNGTEVTLILLDRDLTLSIRKG